MTQEEKKLLLQDLCTRLPYGVKVRYSSYIEFITCTLQSINPIYNIVDLWSKDACFTSVTIDKIKPYLRPMSSMTEEEQKEYRKICDLDMEILENRPMKGEPFPALYNSQDWLDKKMFDYRGLIPMGLAIDATDKNIY